MTQTKNSRLVSYPSNLRYGSFLLCGLLVLCLVACTYTTGPKRGECKRSPVVDSSRTPHDTIGWAECK